jgi:acetoin utilization deacetylase AcuC-like enzyme
VTALPVAYVSHSDCGRHDTGWGHPEHVGRLRAIGRVLSEGLELMPELRHLEGRHATPEELALVHDPGYVMRVRELAEQGGGYLDADTITSPGSWDAARAAVGCVLEGVDLAFAGEVRRTFCAVRPPGHHALRGGGMGFCIFGNVAIAAHYAMKQHGAARVLVVDWDVHHGNGTQALVEDTPAIHFVSMHQWPWYPGTGAADDRGPHGTIWNVPMRAALPPERYVRAFLEAVDQATVGFVPDIVLISAGFDSLAGDPLGGFTLELEHAEVLTREVVTRAARWCEGRVVSALEGGYAPDRLAAACLRHLLALAL